MRSETETRKWRDMKGERKWKMNIERKAEEGTKELIHLRLLTVAMLPLSCF